MKIALYRLCAAAIACAAIMAARWAPAQCESGYLYGSQEKEDLFGGWVSIDGDVIGASESSFGGGERAVFLFRRVQGEWVVEAIVQSPNPDPKEGYGRSALEDGVLVVTADSADAPAFNQGAAYVYRQDPESLTWAYEATLVASDGQAGDEFGWSVDLDGHVAIIGTIKDDIDGVENAGAAYVYRYDGEQWIEEAHLVDPQPQAEAILGWSVAIHGDAAVVGSLKNVAGVHSGAVFFYRRLEGEWLFEGQFTASDANGGEWFGRSSALAGDVAAIGAPRQDGQNGAVYVFRYDGTGWHEEQKLSAAEPVGPVPSLGWDVAVSRDGLTILAGSGNDFVNGFDSGAAHVFRYDGREWYEQAKLVPSDGMAGAQFGGSVGVDGDLAVIGASNHRLHGKAYVYEGLSFVDCNDNDVSDSCDVLAGDSQDSDGDGILDECEGPGDTNGDLTVNVEDLVNVILAWGPCAGPCPADLDGDGVVGLEDLMLVLASWSR